MSAGLIESRGPSGRRPLVFVSSPYNSGDLGIVKNRENAQSLAKYLFNEQEMNPVSPIELYGHLDDLPGESRVTREREILEMCLDLLAACDMVALAPNYLTSVGCRIEARFAEALGIPTRMIMKEDMMAKGFTWEE